MMSFETTYGPASMVLGTAKPYRYVRQYVTKSGERRYALMERPGGGRARRVGTAKLYREVREFFGLPESGTGGQAGMSRQERNNRTAGRCKNK